MPQIDISLVLRWFHIFAGMTAVGGLVYLRFVMLPTLAGFDAGQRAKLEDGLRQRWSKVVAAAIGVLLISGLANFMITVKFYEVPKWYHSIWGTKFLLAMVIFFLSSALAGRSAMATKMRTNATMWLNINLVLAVIIVCLSGMLKTAEKTPKQPATALAVAESVGSAVRSE
jgi:uncharacterized membrane protein